MADFKFAFSINATDAGDEAAFDSEDGSSPEAEGEGEEVRTDCPDVGTNPPAIRAAKEILITDYVVDMNQRVIESACGEVAVSYLDPEDVEASIQEKETGSNHGDVQQAISSHSDLVPCVYEGGLKVWECSLDLMQYLSDENIPLSGRLVLELGCGVGLPGIYAWNKGATVHFQDYNEEALSLMTAPNIWLNSRSDEVPTRCRFFAGDWSLVQDFLEGENIRYDVILTSETIYSLDSQPKLYSIIRKLLKPCGTVYLAAKTHYFGVGGGTRQFEDFVREKGDFHIQTCKVISQGVQREILKMRFLEDEGNEQPGPVT